MIKYNRNPCENVNCTQYMIELEFRCKIDKSADCEIRTQFNVNRLKEKSNNIKKEDLR